MQTEVIRALRAAADVIRTGGVTRRSAPRALAADTRDLKKAFGILYKYAHHGETLEADEQKELLKILKRFRDDFEGITNIDL